MTRGNSRGVETTLALLAVFALAAGVVRWRGAVPRNADAAPAVGSAPVMSSRVSAAELREHTDFIVARDPFRLERVPATVPYVPASRRVAAASAPPPAPKPQLVLKGIIGGPPWMALLDGIPGEQPGALVKAGAVFDKLTIRAITRDSVIVQFPDTTWILTLAGNRR